MIGIDNIIDMRQRGLKPTVVRVEMLPMKRWARAFATYPGRNVDIHLDERDVPSIHRADLRCLVGLHVMVNGPDDDSTERVAAACFKAGASVVEAFRFDLTNPDRIAITKGVRYSPEGVKTVWQK